MNPILTISILCVLFFPAIIPAQETRSLEQARILGASRSKYINNLKISDAIEPQVKADIKTYRKTIEPLLKKACQSCHGPKEQEAEFRVDNLDPDLLHGEDEDWWLEVQNVLSNAEMPPADAEVQLLDVERAKIIQWLSQEVQFASKVRRGENTHSSFRRMTRYEYSYAIQDLLGLPHDFGSDLPPEASSEDGFFNSSEYLQVSANQLEIYRELSRDALTKATVRGEQPTPVRYSISMASAYKAELGMQKKKKLETKPRDNYFLDEANGERVAGGRHDTRKIHVFSPLHLLPAVQMENESSAPKVLILPSNSRHYFNLGKFLPPSGPMKIRVKASHYSDPSDMDSSRGGLPCLQIRFGYKPTNDSHVDFLVGPAKTINVPRDKSRWFEWEIHLGEISRNAYREYTKGGHAPNPTEFIILRNTAKDATVDSIRIEEIEIAVADYSQWPPKSHRHLLPDRLKNESETQYAERVIAKFMKRAWRRPITPDEVERKRKLFHELRPDCDDLQEALVEVLSTVISSPNFLYIEQPKDEDQLSDFELATRLSMFLWASIPDETLLDLAGNGKLAQQKVLIEQINRMLLDARSKRFSKQFVRQWLGLQLLDYLDIDKNAFQDVDDLILGSMKQEPIEMFRYVLANDLSIMDFLHTDYTVADQTLARHYGIKAALGSEFQKVSLKPEHHRGGLLLQSGLLAMNSDGKHSNPLKRGIWLLERILNDPPPPPPAAVPEIDLADPEILKMTLKERLEDHRNDVACNSCHQRIDPWGIAFENFDAVGRWREKIGGMPVDAKSTLFNGQKLDGVEGLKKYLLENRQDQFAHALVNKMSAYALGRPIGFSDRSEIESITTELRNDGDGLATLVRLIVTSKLFHSK